MALWKMEHGFEHKFVAGDLSRLLDLVGLIAITTAPALVLFLLLPLPLLLPVLSLVSFVFACGVALYANSRKASRDAQGVGIWDTAGAFAFIWVVAGIMSNPMRLLDWFDKLSMVP